MRYKIQWCIPVAHTIIYIYMCIMAAGYPARRWTSAATHSGIRLKATSLDAELRAEMCWAVIRHRFAVIVV